MIKKIINIFVIILSCLCLQISFATQQDNSIKHFHNDFCNPNCIFDLDTFKYDEKNNIFSIDIIYHFDYYPGDLYPAIKSPYDKNYITHIIVGTTYSPDTKKITMKYKGFVSSVAISDEEGEKVSDVRMYYNKNKKVFSKIMIEAMLYDLDRTWYFAEGDYPKFYYIKAVQYLFYGAYKRGELYSLEEVFNKIE